MQRFLAWMVTLGSCGVFAVFLLGRALPAEQAVLWGTGCLVLAILAYAWLLLLWKQEDQALAPDAEEGDRGS